MSDTTQLDAVLAVVRDVAHTEILPRFRRVAGQHKDDGSLFTEADTSAQKALVEKLRRIDPSPVLGEEMQREEQEALWSDNQGSVWCIDPLDGTTNFVHGLPAFAVSVALMQKGRSVLGAVYNPVTDEMFYAARGQGAWFNGERLPLRPPSARLADALAAVDMKRLAPPLAQALAVQPPVSSMRNLGASTLEWCYTAAGRLDLYLHGGQKLWDYAAGSLILAEAGGAFATLTQDAFEADNLWHRSVIAATSPALLEQWKTWIRQHHLANAC